MHFQKMLLSSFIFDCFRPCILEGAFDLFTLNAELRAAAANFSFKYLGTLRVSKAPSRLGTYYYRTSQIVLALQIQPINLRQHRTYSLFLSSYGYFANRASLPCAYTFADYSRANSPHCIYRRLSSAMILTNVPPRTKINSIAFSCRDLRLENEG